MRIEDIKESALMALDTLRALGATPSLEPLLSFIDQLFESIHDPQLRDLVNVARTALTHAESWLRQAQTESRTAVEAGARRFALTLGRAIELALLVRQAQWSHDNEQDQQAFSCAQRFARSGVALV